MRKLKIILFFSLIVILVLRIINVKNYSSIYNDGNNIIEGYIDNIKYSVDSLTLTIKGKEKIIAKSNIKYKYNLGDYVLIKGNVSNPSTNTVWNIFNYKNYLLSDKIYKIIDIDEAIKIKENNNILYSLKNAIINRLNTIDNPYLNAFILGDNEIEDEIYDIYIRLGISHLFAISGMHISLFSIMLLKLFNIIFSNKKISYVLTSLLLLIYMLLIGTPSIIRSVLLFIFLNIKKILNLTISTYKMLIIILYLLLLWNPYYVYNVGFLYSFIISFALIKYNHLYKDKKYFLKSLIISLISILVSFPITINNNHSINIMSVLNNLFFIPLISFAIFPFSIIVFIFPKLIKIYDFLISVFENLTFIFDYISIDITLGHMNIFMILIYYVLIMWLLKNFSRKKIILLMFFLLFHCNVNFSNRIIFLDVNQGDSVLLKTGNNSSVMIDTGGIYNYNLVNKRTIPYLKSLGIKTINYLILTHGDYDHMGEAINLVNNFKVENVIFNCGTFNELEQDLIKVLDKKKIPYYSCISELNIGAYKLYFLNTKDYNDENENSSVIYTEIDNTKMLFMGDAGIEKENDILKKYNLKDVDILKVGHHGSNTSSSKEFISNINPKNCLISVGKNNRYGHPKESVINTLDDYCNIYRTDINGSVEIKLNNNNYKIKTISQ